MSQGNQPRQAPQTFNQYPPYSGDNSGVTFVGDEKSQAPKDDPMADYMGGNEIYKELEKDEDRDKLDQFAIEKLLKGGDGKRLR